MYGRVLAREYGTKDVTLQWMRRANQSLWLLWPINSTPISSFFFYLLNLFEAFQLGAMAILMVSLVSIISRNLGDCTWRELRGMWETLRKFCMGGEDESHCHTKLGGITEGLLRREWGETAARVVRHLSRRFFFCEFITSWF